MNRRDLLFGGIGVGALWALPEFVDGSVVSTRANGSLKSLAAKAGLKLGVQAARRELVIPEFVRFLTENFSLVTPGNDLKWPKVHPAPDKYSFDEADWIVDFCQAHGLLVHGHNLCWNSPSANPPWFSSTLTHGNAEKYLTDHITTVMKRYQGRIESWDIVNEPVVAWSKRPDGLYPGIWLNLLGPEYIEIAFHTAKAADPGALRVLNCYYIEGDSPDCETTRQWTLALLQKLRGRGVPVQALGIESHLSATMPFGGQGYIKFLKQIHDMGLQVLITEMDVNDSQVPGSIADRDKVVAQTYYDYLVESIPAGKMNRVIFWSASDWLNWLNGMKIPSFQRADGLPHRPGLLDDSFHPKPALDSVAAALKRMAGA